MKRILEYIKGLFKNKNLFKDIKFGDIIWGKRYDTLEEKKLIPKGHDQGPFIVIKNMGDKLLCSKGTSVKPHDEYLKYNLYLKDNCYKLTKDTYFKINNLSLIDKNSFIKRYDSLYGEDEENFVKLIKLIHKNNYQGEELNLSINVGDIITYNNKNYLVLDSKDDFICVQLDLKNYSFNNIKKIDYSNIKNISTKENIIYSSTINDDALIYILKKYKENLKNNENKKVVQRGSILRKDNCLYYVYGEESEIWNVFEISETKLYNSIRLKINNNFYYTNFNYEKINKKDNFEILHLCLNEEIDEITKIRKDYQKEKKEQDKNIKTKNLRFNVGDIIESKKFKNNRFIIIKVCNKTYECLSINKIKKAIYDPILIRKEETYESPNKSISGIKWLETTNTFNMRNIYKINILNKIFDMQGEYIESFKKNAPIPQRGSLIEYENTYYYIYGEEGENWLVFKLEKNEIESSDKLNINDIEFFTNYEDSTIKKKAIFKILFLCSSDKIEKIKKSKKRYKDTHKKTYQLQKTNNIIMIGSIIKCDEESNEEFLVKSMLGNILVCESNIDKSFPKKSHYINKEKVLLIKQKKK